jgi:hypothetical protein
MEHEPTNEIAPMPEQTHAVAPPMDPTNSVSPFMDSSLPAVAAGTDLYTRQFYRKGQGLPQRRFLPVVRQ